MKHIIEHTGKSSSQLCGIGIEKIQLEIRTQQMN